MLIFNKLQQIALPGCRTWSKIATSDTRTANHANHANKNHSRSRIPRISRFKSSFGKLWMGIREYNSCFFRSIVGQDETFKITEPQLLTPEQMYKKKG
jgi:hypothetical protein